MINFTKGNLLKADVEAIVNTVNCVGVMGKGIALQFKQAYPENYRLYKKACDVEEVQSGRMFIVPTGQMLNPKYIINFPTKRHWKNKSRIEDIETGLSSLIKDIQKLEIRSIAIPPLGAGSGGLAWAEVRPLIIQAFENLEDVDVYIYEPHGAPSASTMPIRTKKPRMTVGRALFIRLIELYRTQGYRLSMLEIQKLAYFLQAAGFELKLDFQKNQYGPYSETIHHVLQRMEGHFIRGYGDRSQRAEIYLLPEAIEEARRYLEQEKEANQYLAQVGNLIEGFETPYGMELLATVHWVMKENHEGLNTSENIIVKTQSWSKRKEQKFSSEQITKAWSRLLEQNWASTSSLSHA
ncbi:MAG: macro domain-containing protein [Chloroflexi bacterium]|nr:macro domain-containing protein [Chloroflexota bacterium]